MWEGVDWIHLTQNRDWLWALVSMIINLQVPYKAKNCISSLVTISFSRWTLFYGVR